MHVAVRLMSLTCLQQAEPGGDWNDSGLDALELSALGLGDAVDPSAPQAAAWTRAQPAQGAQPALHASFSSAIGSSLDALELSALGLGGSASPSAARVAHCGGPHPVGGAQAALHASFSSAGGSSLAGLAPPSAEGGTLGSPGSAARALECCNGAAGAFAGLDGGLSGSCADLHDAYLLLADRNSAGAPPK